MAIVYLARDRDLDRLVALKFIRPPLISRADAVSRLKEEARAISALNHPHIATIYGIDDTEDQIFLVLEYLSGGTLGEVLAEERTKKRTLSLDRVVQYALQIGEGLAYAHDHRVIHRDVKPSNLMLNETGSVKITDFGLAKLAESAQLTHSGNAMGTPAYMSPEQAGGGVVDHRSDIFSFGIVLYELITGRVPFQAAAPPAVLYEIVHAPLPPMNQFRAGVPPGLEAVVRRALAKDPRDRYPSVSALLAELRRMERRASSDTIPVDTVARRPSRRWLTVAALSATLMAGTILWTRSPIARTRLPNEKFLAILPFTCTPESAANRAFCEGLVDNLTQQIGRLQQLHNSLSVVPSSDLRRGAVTSPAQAGRQFGATLALSGSIDRAPDVVWVSATLADTSNQRPLQTFRKQFQAAGAAFLQKDIASEVASMLQVELTPQSRQALEAGATPNAGAYELYLQGRGHLQGTESNSDIDSAIELFQQARERDPTYALAYAGVAEAFIKKYAYTQDSQFLDLADSNARRSAELNAGLAEVHLTVGAVALAKGSYAAAIREFNRALQLDPMSPDATRRLATAYQREGNLSEAEAAYERAIKLRPRYYAVYDNFGFFLMQTGQYGRAEPYLRQGVELNPLYAHGWNNLGVVYQSLGRPQEAEDALRRSLDAGPTPEAYSNLGGLYEDRNRYQEAIPYLEKAVSLAPDNYVAWGNLADGYRWTPGLSSKAPAAYQKAVELGESRLRINPKDATLRSRLAVYEALAQRSDRALVEIVQALNLAPGNMKVLYDSALVYELTGRREQAIRALAAAIKAGYPLEVIRKEPELARLQADSRFTSLAVH